MSQGGGGGVQRNRVFSRLSQISPRPNKDTSLKKSTQLQRGSNPGRMHDWRGRQAPKRHEINIDTLV